MRVATVFFVLCFLVASRDAFSSLVTSLLLWFFLWFFGSLSSSLVTSLLLYFSALQFTPKMKATMIIYDWMDATMITTILLVTCEG